MARSFSERERETIKQDLIEACKQCWTRYGYHKTGVRELAELAGISSGAFYQFFTSKEMLFVATAESFQTDLVEIFHHNMRAYPGKRGVAESLKAIAAELSGASWLSAMWDEWPTIVRKLPPNYVEEDFQRDALQIEQIIGQYGLRPRRSLDQVTQVVDILLASVSRTKFMPGDTGEAFAYIIDAAVDGLFD